jgi:small subunit ribosomal protein S6
MKKDRKNLYEGMYIINATLSEDARTKALEKITNGITERGGEIHKIHDQGRSRMAYPINKNREGYYYLMYFTVNTTAIKDMWQDYHLHEDLMRYITLRADEVQETIEFKSLEQ